MNEATAQVTSQSQIVLATRVPKMRKTEAHVALQLLGANEYDLLLPETRYVAQLIKKDEVLLGAIYGKYTKTTLPLTGRGLLLVTNYRLLLVDKKPLFIQYDEITFDTISGIQYGKALEIVNVTLNTRMGNFSMRTFNDECARHFVQSVEDMLFYRDKWSFTKR